MTPLSVMLWAAWCWGKSWAQLKHTKKKKEPWRQELWATKDFSYKLSLSKPLKNVTKLHKHCCSVSTPIERKQSFSRFLSDAVGATVGLEWVSLATWSIREVKRDERRQEVGMCNGAVGLQEVAFKPDHTAAPDPLPHFQQKETLQLLECID